MMAKRSLPEQSELLQLLRYEPETGKLFWKGRPPSSFSTIRIANGWNTKWAGKEAFTAVDACGYKGGLIHGVGFKAHRIIFKMMTGIDPDEVDHIDGDPANNRWTNLRDVDRTGNNRNASRRVDNSSGVTGVYLDKCSGKWRATINAGGKISHLGRFNCLGAAVRVRKVACAEYGYSPRHGSPKTPEQQKAIDTLRSTIGA
jgi:hypothetical protein